MTPRATAPRVAEVVADGLDWKLVGILADPYTGWDGDECVVVRIQTADHVDVVAVEAALRAKAVAAGFNAITEDEYFAESDAEAEAQVGIARPE
ncbi:MAG: hypothetical protein QM809_01155 [Gordonia sp. (in: high G+C Gram-positive bacteria)]|uniref:hypothetical protein n=1 Tax=Gordonia sp. (in: high G+C Gram-positive bacteria) TaxID=84139 RepID=UPI0039E3C66F